MGEKRKKKNGKKSNISLINIFIIKIISFNYFIKITVVN